MNLFQSQEPLTFDELYLRLKKYFFNKPFSLVIKNNRSVFLHVLEEKNQFKLFLHRLFLFASENICSSLARYVLNNEKEAFVEVKKFAYDFFSYQDYSSLLNKQKIFSLGVCYDLKEIYDRLNERYFDKKVNAYITWISKPRYKTWSHLTFGSYDDVFKLIRINKLLDDFEIPPYFLSYIIYHEMLHQIIPTFLDDKGRRRVHSKEFKEREKVFLYYSNAIFWEKKKLFKFLRKKREVKKHGRPQQMGKY